LPTKSRFIDILLPRVLRIINRFNIGGPVYNVSYLSAYLPDNYQTLLVGGEHESNEASALYIPEGMGISPQIITSLQRTLNPIKDFKAYCEIKKYIKEFKPDIVHTHASKAGAIGRLAALHCKVPVIVHTFHGHIFHGYFSFFQTLFYKFIERYLAKKSNAIVCISKLQKDELTTLHRICKAENTHIIPLGFNLERFNNNTEMTRTEFRKKHEIDTSVIAIGIIGRLTAIKNHRLFIDAVFHCIKQTDKKIKAFIIGDGELRNDLEQYIQSNILQSEKEIVDCFVFTGWEKNLEDILPGLDIVCLTSINEGTPVSLIEAQAAGRYIVSTNAGGVSDILHPDAGTVCKNDEAYKQQLLQAIQNIEKHSLKALAGIDFVKERFSYQRLVSDTLSLYEKLLAGN